MPHRTYTWGVDLSRAAGAAALDGAAGIGGLLAINDPDDPNDPNDTSGAWAVLSDGNGNVVQLIDCTAATVNDAIACHYEYDPYGNRVNDADPNEPENWLRFSTKYFDAETGLGYWGYRYYDPQTGRWLTRDPIGERGGVNLYAYVLNRPVSAFDSLGHRCGECCPSPTMENKHHKTFMGFEHAKAYSNFSPTAEEKAKKAAEAVEAYREFKGWLDRLEALAMGGGVGLLANEIPGYDEFTGAAGDAIRASIDDIVTVQPSAGTDAGSGGSWPVWR